MNIYLFSQLPHLKNAPTEGEYTKDIAVTHKPFGIETRLVRCLRCGKRGHQAGERECQLTGKDPNGKQEIFSFFFFFRFSICFFLVLQINLINNMKIQ